MKRLVIFLCFLLIASTNSYAGNKLWLDLNGSSYHFGSNSYCYRNKCKGYNQENYGLGASYETSRHLELQGGFFRNSYYKHSNYFNIKIKQNVDVKQLKITPGIALGFVSGYKNTEVSTKLLIPFVLPTVGLSYRRMRVVAGILPIRVVSQKSSVKAVATLQLGVLF